MRGEGLGGRGTDGMNCSRYNVAFRATETDLSLSSLRSDKSAKIRPYVSCENSTSLNFSKYPLFPVNTYRSKQYKSPPLEPRRKTNNIKWIGVKGVI